MVLVDSSVWIDYFRNGKNKKLDQLIEEDLVVSNDVVLTELIPALQLQKKNDVIESLNSLQNIPINIDWDLLRAYQLINLQNGINKVGIPHLIIVQQVIEEGLTLFSLDKYFNLMLKYFEFKLL